MAHDLSQWFLPIQPTWFAEGMATYLETTKYDPATHLATMGEASELRLEWLTGSRQFWPTADLFAARDSLALEPRVSALFYS